MKTDRKAKNLSSFVRCISVANGIWQAQKWSGEIKIGDDILARAGYVNHGAPTDYEAALNVANRLEASR